MSIYLPYLIKAYNISYNYSATLFLESKRLQNQSKKTVSNKILACASFYPPLEYWEKSPDTALKKLRTPKTYDLRTMLGPLPAAQSEVESLEKLYKGNFLKGNAVNEDFFKKYAQDYSIIHLAMHGILEKKQPLLSSLAFTENKDSLEDNFLQAYEISRQKLNANLVVLSACETGYGSFEQGEGVLSLARSFMYAGVPSLVVSLWQVNDASTAAIMSSFYQYLSEGFSKDMALRQAKLDFISKVNGILAHPAFWSPFIQLGDARPIELHPKRTLSWWGVGSLLLLLILGGVILGQKYWTKKNA